jgi:oligoribonuclease (3'-5' exoribonuclease)
MASDQKEWLDKSILCWIDYETTGVNLQDPKVVPIEVGFLLTDMQMCPLGDAPGYEYKVNGFSSLIDWGFGNLETWKDWSEDALSAFPIHKITHAQIANEGLTPISVAEQMYTMIVDHTPEDGRCILISDNIQFEWQLTKQLMAQLPFDPAEWPFHYCGWDTSVLQLVPGLGFEDPPNPPHRAFDDARGLWIAARKALFGKDEKGIDRLMNVGVPSAVV